MLIHEVLELPAGLTAQITPGRSRATDGATDPCGGAARGIRNGLARPLRGLGNAGAGIGCDLARPLGGL